MGEMLAAVRAAADTAPAPTLDDVKRPTLDDIKRWPAAVDVSKACSAYGLSRSYGYELVSRGAFPAKTIKVGGRYLIVTASIIAALSSGPD